LYFQCFFFFLAAGALTSEPHASQAITWAIPPACNEFLRGHLFNMCIMKNFLLQSPVVWRFSNVQFQLYLSIVWENTLCDFYFFRFFKVCFVAQIMVCVGECAHDLENDMYSLVVRYGILQYQMSPVDE
jgi:hypothetical protein